MSNLLIPALSVIGLVLFTSAMAFTGYKISAAIASGAIVSSVLMAMIILILYSVERENKKRSHS